MQLKIKQALQRGLSAHNSGNLKEAERLYRAILRAMPAHPDANHNLGLIAVSAKNFKAALILPDGKPDSPAFLVFENYEKILKWNRSLRFGISICTLANMIKT